jgi:hypothetical protein
MLVSIVQLFELPELELLSFFEQEMMVTLKNIDRERNKIFFIFSSIPKEYYWFVKETTLFYHKFVNFTRVWIVLGGYLTMKN